MFHPSANGRGIERPVTNMSVISRPTFVQAPLVKGPLMTVSGPQKSVVKGPVDVLRGPSNIVGNSLPYLARSQQGLIRAPVATYNFPRLNENREWRLNEEAKEKLFAPPQLDEEDDVRSVRSAVSEILSVMSVREDSGEARRLAEKKQKEEADRRAAQLLAQELEEEERKTKALVRKPTFEEILRAGLLEVDADGSPVPEQVPGGKSGKKAFTWLRFDNSEPARAMRRDIAAQTREASLGGGYKIGRKAVKLQHLQTMLENTRAVTPSLGLNPPGRSIRTSRKSTKVSGHDGLLLPTAFSLGGRHKDRIAVVSAASAYHCGGGFTTGGRHALEEACCIQSTLFESLEQIQEQILGAAAVHSGRPYIPFDGAIISPSVEVFRHGSDEGYSFMDEPFTLTVISMAMLNKNPSLRDAPVDAPEDPHEYDEAVRAKFVSTVSAAIMAGCTALVMPDVGCGVYQNPPDRVGRIFGEVLQQFWGEISEVAVVGMPDFKQAVMEAAVDPQERDRQAAEAAREQSRREEERRREEAERERERERRAEEKRRDDAQQERARREEEERKKEEAKQRDRERRAKERELEERRREHERRERAAAESSQPPVASNPAASDMFVSLSEEDDEPLMCKFNCGRHAKRGRTPKGRKFDTCCRKCAVGKGDGSHSRDCGA